ncbi:MAG: hypothetical protein KDB27_17725 [Planctomycetales bacterium]|nr:hypothetical protein [Planctomycetales bacterium]
MGLANGTSEKMAHLCWFLATADKHGASVHVADTTGITGSFGRTLFSRTTGNAEGAPITQEPGLLGWTSARFIGQFHFLPMIGYNSVVVPPLDGKQSQQIRLKAGLRTKNDAVPVVWRAVCLRRFCLLLDS